MIKELRVGNHLLYTITRKVRRVEAYDLVVSDEAIITFNDLYKGIPLTKGLLLDHGFQEWAGGLFIDLDINKLEFIQSYDLWYPLISQPPEMSSDTEQRISLRSIKYYHQLENLYHILTGNELEHLNPLLQWKKHIK